MPLVVLLNARFETVTFRSPTGSAVPMPVAARKAKLATVMSVCSPAVPSAMAPPVRSDRSAALFSVIELLIVMSPVFDALPIRSVGVKMRSSSAFESSSVLTAASVIDPRSTAQSKLSGWIVTLCPDAEAVMPDVLSITTRSALMVTSPESENTASGIGAMRTRGLPAPGVKVTLPPAMPCAPMLACRKA